MIDALILLALSPLAVASFAASLPFGVAAGAFALVVIAAPASAQPSVDCVPSGDVNATRAFYDRTTFRFCISRDQPLSLDSFDLFEWQIHYAHKAEWEPLVTTLLPEVELEVPIWSRFEVRYQACRNTDHCSGYSLPSQMIVAGPNVDIDGSGSISTSDIVRACRDVINPLHGRSLVAGEYVAP